MIQAYMNWSGGKDSALCLYEAARSGLFTVTSLLTSMSAEHDRISMHGVRRELLQAQANALNLPLGTIELPEDPGMETYEQLMQEAVENLRAEGNTAALFGDIFLEDLRRYRETQLAAAGITCSFPLWGRSTKQLPRDFIAAGFKAIIVCVNEALLHRSFCGREVDEQFLADLPSGVDPCGENGEYHSFVYDGPIFREPVAFKKGEVVCRTYPAPEDESSCFTDAAPTTYRFYFQDILPG